MALVPRTGEWFSASLFPFKDTSYAIPWNKSILNRNAYRLEEKGASIFKGMTCFRHDCSNMLKNKDYMFTVVPGLPRNPKFSA